MIDKISSFTFNLFLFLLPLFFLPINNTPIDSDKQILLIFASLLLFFFFILKVTREKRLILVATPVDALIFLLILLSLASTFVIAPNKIESLTTPLGAGTLMACALLFFTLTHNPPLGSSSTPLTAGARDKQPTTYNLQPLTLSASLVALLTILQQLTTYNLQPLGGLLPTFSFLLPMLVYLGAKMVIVNHLGSGPDSIGDSPKVKEFDRTQKLQSGKLITLILRIFTLFLVTTATIISAYHLATDQKPLLLPFSSGWAIMMEMYKNIPNFLLGVGPGNFTTAFTLGKPLALNFTPLWSAVAFTSSNFLLTLATEAGVFAAIIFLFLTIRVLRLITGDAQDPLKSDVASRQPYLVPLLTALFLQFLFPSNISLFILTFILLAFVVPKKEIKQLTINNRQATMYFVAPISLVILLLLFFQGKIYLSDISYRKSVAAISSGNLQQAYDQSIEAITLNQYSEKNLSLSSSLSLEVARSLSNSPNATTSAQQISNLMQQAVAHAQRATSLNPQNSQNYAQLAQVYQALIGGIQNAEQFALDSLNAQMRFDPTSPQPRIAAGQLLLAGGQIEAARNFFTQAVNLKPDWNNAHYNLASLLKQTGDNQGAAFELQRTLDLTPTDNQDYQRIQKELEEVKALLPAEATPSSSLQPPTSSFQPPTSNFQSPAPSPTPRPSRRTTPVPSPES